MNQPYNISYLTWNNQPQETSLATKTNIDGSTGYVQWDIKGLVNDWYGGTTNHGVVLRYNEETAQAEVFASADNQAYPNPYVEITYATKSVIDPRGPGQRDLQLRVCL